MSDHDDGVGPGGSRHRRWTLILAVVAALAVGVGLGYVWRSVAEPTPAPAPSPPPAAAPPTMPPSALPSPCVAIAQRGSELLTQLDAAARAVGAFDAATLRQVLDEIRRLRDELQRDVDACRGQTGSTPAPVPPDPVIPAPVTPAPAPLTPLPPSPVPSG